MAPTAEPKLEYLMTLHGDLAPPQSVDAAMLIFNCTGGWVEGPKIQAKIVAPAADWLQVSPSGVFRLDVRVSLITDDAQTIFMNYGGIIAHSEESAAKMASGAAITEADGLYFVAAPTFRTSAPKYAWLNRIQAVGKMAAFSTDPAKSFVRYDIFGVY